MSALARTEAALSEVKADCARAHLEAIREDKAFASDVRDLLEACSAVLDRCHGLQIAARQKRVGERSD